MRRFGLMIFALAVLFAIVRGGNDDAERGNVDHPPSADGKGQETAAALQTGRS